MTLITLLTDFGNQDGFAGIMKGVIWRISPQVQIADLTHEISPQNVLQGALILAQAVPFFPAETIHVAVVDPGVGTSRRALGISTANQFFIGPDNGIFTAVLELSEAKGYKTEIYHLDAPEFWLPQVSRSFHGRDIFAPVAAHLANGRSLSDMGSLIDNPVRITIPRPVKTRDGWKGQIVAADYTMSPSITLSLPSAKSLIPNSWTTIILHSTNQDSFKQIPSHYRPHKMVYLLVVTQSLDLHRQ